MELRYILARTYWVGCGVRWNSADTFHNQPTLPVVVKEVVVVVVDRCCVGVPQVLQVRTRDWLVYCGSIIIISIIGRLRTVSFQ